MSTSQNAMIYHIFNDNNNNGDADMRLRDLREDNDLNQKDIASLLNIKQNTYSQYENGKRDIPLSALWMAFRTPIEHNG